MMYRKVGWKRLNPWGKSRQQSKALFRMSTEFHKRVERCSFGSIDDFIEDIGQTGRHKSHILTDMWRGRELLAVMGIFLVRNEFGLLMTNGKGFDQYLSMKRVKKKKEVKRSGFKRGRCKETGRFFWEERERDEEDEEYKSFL